MDKFNHKKVIIRKNDNIENEHAGREHKTG